MLRNAGAGEQRFGHHGQGLPGAGRGDHRGRQLPGAHPCLARTWHTIAADNGDAEPLIAVRIGNGILDGFARTHAHGVVLRDDHIDARALRRHQAHPGAHALARAFLRPPPSQAGEMHAGRQRFL